MFSLKYKSISNLVSAVAEIYKIAFNIYCYMARRSICKMGHFDWFLSRRSVWTGRRIGESSPKSEIYETKSVWSIRGR